MSKIDHVIMFIASIASAIVIGCLMGSIIVCCLASCTTTKYVTVPEVHTDTVMIMKQQRDSIWMHDSIHVWQGSDTVRIERWHTKYIDRLRTDTLYQSRVDSVPVPYTVEKEVPAQLTAWQKFRIWIGDVVVIATILLIIFAVWKAIRIT